MTNYLLALFHFLKFRVRYPDVRFVRPKKHLGILYSQDGQDLFLLTLLLPLLDRTGSTTTLLDVGANHPIKFSNSLFFERHFNCRTIAIDPLHEHAAAWLAERPTAEFINVAVGAADGPVALGVPGCGEDDMFASVAADAKGQGKISAALQPRQVEMVRLSGLLAKRGVKEVLFASIDVEGHELEVLKGIDFDAVKFHALVIENNANGYLGDDAIRLLMKSKGYLYYARIGWLDDVFIHPSCLKTMNPGRVIATTAVEGVYPL